MWMIYEHRIRPVVAISGNYANGEDTLAFRDQMGSADRNATTRQTDIYRFGHGWQIWKRLCASITYTNNSDDPSRLRREPFQFTVNDG